MLETESARMIDDVEMTEKMSTLKSEKPDRKTNIKMSGEDHRYLDIWTAKKIGAIETGLTRQLIDDYTIKKLRENLVYAIANSPFYKRKYSGIAQEGSGEIMRADRNRIMCLDRSEIAQTGGSMIRQPGDSGIMRPGDSGRISLPKCDADFLHFFQEFPFTSQEELRQYGMDFLCVRPGEISRIVTLDTGGSTGTPKRVYFTEEDQNLTVDYFQNGMQLLVSDRDTVLILMPAKMPGSIGKLLARGLVGFGARTVEYGLPQMRLDMAEVEIREEAEQLLDLIEKEGVTSVVALPTHMRMLAEAAVKRQDGSGRKSIDRKIGQRVEACPAGTDMESPDENRSYSGYLRLKSVLLSAEYVAEEDAQFIEQVFSCKVYEHYGMTEMGLGCAVSCGHDAGYHVREADLYLEIIDPDTQIPVKDGQFGEIVFTTLTRKGMPFIRYRTGDYSRWIAAKCSCGSQLKRLDKVRPRNVVKGYLR